MNHDKRIKALNEKRNAIIEEMEAMVAAAVDDQGEERAFTEEEQAKFDAFEANAKALKNTIEAEERAMAAEMKPVEPKKEEGKEMTVEERALVEERAFADYLRGVVSEERGTDYNMEKTDGAATIPTSIANKIIKKNLERLVAAKVKLEVRMLIVPGCTDGADLCVDRIREIVGQQFGLLSEQDGDASRNCGGAVFASQREFLHGKNQAVALLDDFIRMHDIVGGFVALFDIAHFLQGVVLPEFQEVFQDFEILPR